MALTLTEPRERISSFNLWICCRIPLGPFFLAVCGVFFGIFLGGWILALAEIAKVFPVFARRLKLSQGLSPVIISIAAGKILGSLFYYAMGWQDKNDLSEDNKGTGTT